MIQWVLTLALLLAALFALREWRVSKLVGLGLLAVSVVGGVFVWVPGAADATARQLGVGRGADLVLATAPHSAAIASTVDGLKPRGKLLVVAAPLEPLQISALSLLSGKAIAGWPSGSAIDSEETMRFSASTGVRPRVERFPLEKAEEAFGEVMSNRVRFRAVLVP